MRKCKLYASSTRGPGAGEILKCQAGGNHAGVCQCDCVLAYDTTGNIKSVSEIYRGSITAGLSDDLHDGSSLLFDFGDGLIFYPGLHQKRQKSGDGKYNGADYGNIEQKLDEGKTLASL